MNERPVGRGNGRGRGRWSRRELALVAAGLVVAVGGVAFMADAERGDGGRDGGQDEGREDAFSARRQHDQQLMAWADGMCENMASLKTLRADSAEKADKFSGRPASVATTYLMSAASALEDISRGFEALDPPTRLPDTGRLRAGYIKELDQVRPEVMKLSDADRLANLPAREKIGRAERVVALVASIGQPTPGADALVQRDGRFEAAFNSPGCQASREAAL